MGPLFNLLHGAGPVVSTLFGAAMFAFSVWMLVDCVRNNRDYWWIWIILISGGLGAFIYFYVHHWDKSKFERLFGDGAARRRINDLQGRIHFFDNAANYEELGDVYRKIGKHRDAEVAYRAALERAPDTFDVRAHLGYSLLGQKRVEEAWTLLEPALAARPDFDNDELLWQCARCDAARGQLAAARDKYERFLARHSYYEAQVEFANLLFHLDERTEAAALAQEIVDDLDNSPAYIQRQNRRWRSAAKKLFKRATAASRPGTATNQG